MPRSTYSKLFFSVNASSCAAVAPASRMWYPEIEIGLYFGACTLVQSNMSTIRRSAGPGGYTHACCA